INTIESEGPGGGGGGGYIANYLGTITASAAGGANGTTNSYPIASFIPNGATKGGAGIANAPLQPVTYLTLQPPSSIGATICKGDGVNLFFRIIPDPTTSPADTLFNDSTYNYTWSPTTFITKTNTRITAVFPPSNTDYVITYSDGTCASQDTFKITVIPNVD